MHDRTYVSYLNDSLGVLETENMGSHSKSGASLRAHPQDRSFLPLPLLRSC
jgi:hypothetical protein